VCQTRVINQISDIVLRESELQLYSCYPSLFCLENSIHWHCYPKKEKENWAFFRVDTQFIMHNPHKCKTSRYCS